MMNNYRAWQADTVMMTNIELRAHKINAGAAVLFDGPQVLALLVKSAFGVHPKRIIALEAALAERVGAAGVNVRQDEIGLIVEIPKPPPARYTLTSAALAGMIGRELRAGRRVTASMVPVGVDMAGRVVWLNLGDAASCHLGILGLTGSGKSMLMSWLTLWLARHNSRENLQMIAISPKLRNVGWMAGGKHLAHPPVSDLQEAVRVLAHVVHDLEERNASGRNRPVTLLLIDEIPDIRASDPRVDDYLARIAAIGRESGVVLVAGSQRADQASIGPAVYNLPARAVGRVGSSSFAYVTSGKSGTGADRLLGRGDFILAGAEFGGVRLQAPLVTEADRDRLPRGPERRLDLPTAMPIFDTERRGAHNATALDDETLLAIASDFQAGETLRGVMARYNIGYSRAKKYREIALEEAVS